MSEELLTIAEAFTDFYSEVEESGDATLDRRLAFLAGAAWAIQLGATSPEACEQLLDDLEAYANGAASEEILGIKETIN